MVMLAENYECVIGGDPDRDTTDLARIEFGPITLGRLKPGTVRSLTVHEMGDHYKSVGL